MKLITGYKGFIGSHLYFPEVTLGIDLKDGNDILTSELHDADVVIHLAAQTDVRVSIVNPTFDAENNIIGTIRLATKYKDKRFIFASSGGAIQEKIESPYGLSKFCAEEYIKMICDDYVILRFPNIYGLGSHSVVEKFIEGEVNIFGDGSATRDYVHVDDLVRAIQDAVHWEKGTYQLGSEESTTVLQLAQATGKKINYLPKIEGELQHSKVANTSPNWKPEINVINYIKEQCMI